MHEETKQGAAQAEMGLRKQLESITLMMAVTPHTHTHKENIHYGF